MCHLCRFALILGLALVACVPARGDPPRVPVYPTLSPNPDLVPVGPYAPIEAGPANWGTGLTGGPHSLEALSLGQRYRIRQTGTIQRIRLNVSDPAGLTGFYFRVWRKIGPTYDIVGTSENLAPRMIAGMNTLDLQRPIVAQEGDYYGYRIESTAAANFFALTSQPAVASHVVLDGAVRCSDFDWQAQPSVANTALPIEMQMRAPILVAIGDGTVIGHFDHHTFLETKSSQPAGTELLTYLGERWRVTRQNMGAHGQTTSQVAKRFMADVVSLRPRLVLIGVGLYEMIVGPPPKQRFLDLCRTMLDTCQAHDIKPLVMLIQPSLTALSNDQSRQRDDWNAALRELVRQYPKAVIIDDSAYLGVARPGGPAGNLWNTKKEYLWPDGLHWNDAGIQQAVQAIIDQYTEP